ncbi:ribonuclease P protein component [Patescibacteria group bacterium]|nr:ribonuclease P protein component [Patescibacteria group bacterium]
MLAKKYRLPIQSVLRKNGHSFKSRYFLFKVFSRPIELDTTQKTDFNRFGVIISKKVSKKATDRNQLKRIVFDFVKKFIFSQSKNKIGKFDILIILSPGVAKLKKIDIIKELNESLSKCLKI